MRYAPGAASTTRRFPFSDRPTMSRPLLRRCSEHHTSSLDGVQATLLTLQSREVSIFTLPLPSMITTDPVSSPRIGCSVNAIHCPFGEMRTFEIGRAHV